MTVLAEISGTETKDALPAAWIFDQIEQWARRSPNRAAFVLDHQNNVEEYGYEAVLEQANAVAGTLVEKGICAGDHIGVLMGS